MGEKSRKKRPPLREREAARPALQGVPYGHNERRLQPREAFFERIKRPSPGSGKGIDAHFQKIDRIFTKLKGGSESLGVMNRPHDGARRKKFGHLGEKNGMALFGKLLNSLALT